MSSNKSTRLSYQQYLQWNEDRTINPKTGRKIKENGIVYNKILAGWNKFQVKYSEDECKAWNSKKGINPKTNRFVKKGNPIYDYIESQCEVYDKTKNIDKYLEMIEKEREECEIDEKSDKKKKSCLRDPLTILCRGEKCMVKSCPWDGKFGINFSVFPKAFVKVISLLFPYLDFEKRCCCFCFGHLLFMLSFVGVRISTSACSSPDVKEIGKIQSTIDKIETSGVDATLKKLFVAESVKQLQSKSTLKSFSIVFKYMKSSVVDGLKSGVEMILEHCL
jgi:hypothetical protein